MTTQAPPTIMLVDDDRDLSGTIKDRLERILGVKVDPYYDADSMLDKLLTLDRQPSPYRIIVLDMWLPRREGSPVEAALGLRLLRAHRVLSPSVPVLVYTAFEDYEVCVDCIKSGAYDYIPKLDAEPNRDRLVERCQRILAPEPDELDSWMQEHGGELLERFGGLYVALIPLVDALAAKVEYRELGGRAVIAADTMGEVRRALLRNSALRWMEPRILRVTKSHENARTN
jgi:FixJ family two-component response regulator